MIYKYFDKKTWLGESTNEELAQELHKPVIKKFKRRKVYARFKDNIWVADVAEIGYNFLLIVVLKVTSARNYFLQ